MADIEAVLKKTIDGLPRHDAAIRMKVYDKARSQIRAKLLAAKPDADQALIDRNMTVVERAKPYVMAAQAMGAPGRAIMFRHLLPNVGGPLLVLGAYSMSWVILAFAGLSFLGLGVEPGTAEWGRMVAEARSHMRAYPRLVLAPGLSIMALVIVVNLLGDALADRWRVDQVLARSFRKGRPA